MAAACSLHLLSFSHSELLSVRNPEKQLRKIGKEARYSPSKPGCAHVSIVAFLVWLVASPILQLAAFFARCFGAHNLSKQWTVLSIHLSYNTHILENFFLPKLFRKKLLASARNVHKLSTSKVFCRSGCYSPDGVCSGMSLHFLHLALKTAHVFQECDAHMRAVTRRFRKGAPLQSTYLQALYTTQGKEKVFGEIASEMRLDESVLLSIEPIIANYTKKNPQSVTQEIQDRWARERQEDTSFTLMAPGAYYVSITDADISAASAHALVYIKQSANLSYLFDPNVGTLRFQGEKSGQEAQEFFSRYYDEPLIVMRKVTLCPNREIHETFF